MNKQSTAIKPVDQLKELIVQDDIRQQFIDLLGPDDGPGFLVSVFSIVTENPRLAQCEPTSIIRTAARAAALRLPLDPGLGMAAAIPYGDKAAFQIMKAGYVNLALKTGLFEVLNVDNVTEGETITTDKLTGKTTIAGTPGGGVIGYFSYFRLTTGQESFFYMTVEELQAHGARYSKSYNKKNSLWKTNFPAMAEKTVLKLNLKKYAPLAVSQSAIEEWTDDTDENGFTDGAPADDDVIEGEFVEPELHTETKFDLVGAAMDMTTKKGSRLGDLSDSELDLVRQESRHEALRQAAGLIIDFRIEQASKAASNG